MPDDERQGPELPDDDQQDVTDGPGEVVGDDDDAWVDDEVWVDDGASTGRGQAFVVAAFIAGTAVGLVLVLAWNMLTGGPETATADPSRDATSSASVTSDPGSPEVAGASASRPAATRLSRCSRAARALRASLDSARPALDQWSVHVGAMNKLVVGEITLQQAAEFWENTRVGASREVGRFRDALAPLQRRGVDCPRPDMLGKGARALPGCVREVDAQVKALLAARTSVDTWATHIHHMDMLRTGDMSADEATALWLKMWPRGVRELEAFRIALRGTSGADGCTGAGSG